MIHKLTKMHTKLISDSKEGMCIQDDLNKNRLDCHSSNELRNDGTLGCQTSCHCEEQQPKTGNEAIHN